jgi:hypothetical protein
VAPPETSQKARLFDVRRVIGGLFVGYGVLVSTVGLLDAPERIDPARGADLNLWAGLGMLVLGGLLLLWQRLRPARRRP